MRNEKCLLDMEELRLRRAAGRGRSSLRLKPQGLGCPTEHETTRDLTIGCAAAGVGVYPESPTPSPFTPVAIMINGTPPSTESNSSELIDTSTIDRLISSMVARELASLNEENTVLQREVSDLKAGLTLVNDTIKSSITTELSQVKNIFTDLTPGRAAKAHALAPAPHHGGHQHF